MKIFRAGAGILSLLGLALAVRAADVDRIDAHTPLPSAALVLAKSGQGISQGSGFVVDRDARILITNHHVTGAKGEVMVIFPVIENGQALVRRDFYLTRAPRIRATVLGSDPKLDLAAIRLESVPFTVPDLKLADASPLVGDRAHIVGNPANQPQAWVYDAGTVQKVGKAQLQYQSGQKTEAQTLEVKAEGLMAPGASGGPVVNHAGLLIGVLSAGGNAGKDLFCIDVSEVRYFLGTVHRGLGTEAIRQGNYSQAIADCDRAIQVNADDPLHYNERGAAHSFLDEFDAAIADYTRALKLDPKLVRAYRNRGSAHYHLQNFEQAAADASKAIELDPKYASAYQVRARVFQKLGRLDEARADTEKAAQLAVK